jgi:hypothetical protein
MKREIAIRMRFAAAAVVFLDIFLGIPAAGLLIGAISKNKMCAGGEWAMVEIGFIAVTSFLFPALIGALLGIWLVGRLPNGARRIVFYSPIVVLAIMLIIAFVGPQCAPPTFF